MRPTPSPRDCSREATAWSEPPASCDGHESRRRRAGRRDTHGRLHALLLVLRLDVVHPFSGVLVLAHADDLRVLGLHAAREAEHDRVLQMKGLQNAFDRLVGDLGPRPLGKAGMRQVVEHLPTHGIHVLLPDASVDIGHFSQQLTAPSQQGPARPLAFLLFYWFRHHKRIGLAPPLAGRGYFDEPELPE